MKTILSGQQLALTVKRLAHQILENNATLDNTVIIGLQPRGIFLSDRIVTELASLINTGGIEYGKLDITFYRDDVRKSLHIANTTDIPFSLENKHVILIDCLLYTSPSPRDRQKSRMPSSA